MIYNYLKLFLMQNLSILNKIRRKFRKFNYFNNSINSSESDNLTFFEVKLNRYVYLNLNVIDKQN